jgi:succinoglycan biosynthesis transport protein ExoP
MENDVHVQHYLDVIKRRKFHFIIPAIIVFFAAATVALMLPPVYKATAKIVVESHAVSENLVHSAATGYIEERLHDLSQRVMSSKNLLATIERFGLYSDLRDENTSQRLVQEMKKHIVIEHLTTNVLSERSGREMPITTSLTVSFEGKKPEKLADVANHLASLFLEEDARKREEKAHTTIQFLEKRLADLRSEIQETEAKLAAFKEKHFNELPELMALNLKTMDQLERQMDNLEQQIKDLTNRKIYLEGQLVLLEPTMNKVTADGKKILTPKEELSVLRSQYLTLSASLSESHPDVIKLKKKLDALEGEVGTQQELRQIQSELYDKEHQLELLRKRVSSQHPDAIRLQKEVSLLRRKLQEVSKKQKALKLTDEKPENPAYINLQTNVDATKMEIEATRKQLQQVQEKYEEYRKRVENSPKVEQEYLNLQRDYTNAKNNYQETENRLRVAQEAKGLEEGRMAEKFTLIGPATTPLEPYKPNRLAIILLGLVLAVGSGTGFGSLSEYMDNSVHTADELAKIAGHKVLTVIPYWETSHEITRKRRKIWVLVGSTVAIAAVALVALNLLFTP